MVLIPFVEKCDATLTDFLDYEDSEINVQEHANELFPGMLLMEDIFDEPRNIKEDRLFKIGHQILEENSIDVRTAKTYSIYMYSTAKVK